MALTGDTVRLKAHFKTIKNESINPTNVVLTLYDTEQVEIETFNLDDTINQESEGVFFYDYILPDDEQQIVFEFRGLHNNKPIIARGMIEPKFI